MKLINASDLLPAILADLVREARHGDEEAARELHRQLAFCLARGELPDAARDALILMHSGIAAGVDARHAMLTAKPPHRPPLPFRDETIVLEIMADKSAEPKTSLAELFRRAAKKYKIDPDNVRKNYYRQKNIIFPRFR